MLDRKCWWDIATKFAVVFDPAGEVLFSGGRDNLIKKWDLATRREIATFRGHEWAIYGLAWMPGTMNQIVSLGGSVVRWNLDQQLEPETIGCEGTITDLAMTLDGSTIASVCSGRLEFWEARSGRKIGEKIDPAANACSIAVSPAGVVAAGYDNGMIEVLDVKTRQSKVRWKAGDGAVTHVEFCDDRRKLSAKIERDGTETIMLWDWLAGAPEPPLPENIPSAGPCVLSTSKDRLAYVESKTAIMVVDLQTGKKRCVGALGIAPTASAHDDRPESHVPRTAPTPPSGSSA